VIVVDVSVGLEVAEKKVGYMNLCRQLFYFKGGATMACLFRCSLG